LVVSVGSFWIFLNQGVPLVSKRPSVEEFALELEKAILELDQPWYGCCCHLTYTQSNICFLSGEKLSPDAETDLSFFSRSFGAICFVHDVQVFKCWIMLDLFWGCYHSIF
jgi:hypothetical protein